MAAPHPHDLIDLLADVAGVDADKLRPEIRFVEQSLGATTLRDFGDAVHREYGLSVPDLVQECTSIDALTACISDEHRAGADAPSLTVFSELGFQDGFPEHLFYE